MSGVKGVMEVKQIKRTRKYCGHETSSSTLILVEPTLTCQCCVSVAVFITLKGFW